LVVDDSEALRRLLETALGRAGFETVLAANGADACACLAERPAVDLALLDVRMPGLSGPETFLALRARRPDLLCCFMTGDSGDYDPAELIRMGALAVIPKPFHLADLVQSLRGFLDESSGARAA
jgi:DNA-binding NtrC family response regulator